MSVATHVLSSLMIMIGLAIVVRTLAERGGITLGLLVGVLFIAAGAGRLFLERRA
jgi:hypothetical protein